MNCKGCGKEETAESKLLVCAVCKSVRYCSADCQKDHWKSHKSQCTQEAVLNLFKAIQNNDSEMLQRLAKTKRVVNGKVDYTPTDWEDAHEMGHWTPLHECVRCNNVAAMDTLIAGGLANLNIKDADGESPVFVSASNSNPDLLLTLLKAGADPDAVAGDGFSALMMAVRDGHYENTKALLEAGANLYRGGNMFGRGAVELAQMQASGQGGLRMRQG